MSKEVQNVDNELQKKDNRFNVVDLTKELPDLDNMEAAKFDLMSDYWTPEVKGEFKRVVFTHIDSRMVRGENDELIELKCAYFLEQVAKGDYKQISNGSKRLVGAIENAQIQKGTALLITYMGKRSNTTNSFKSDYWSVKPLI